MTAPLHEDIEEVVVSGEEIQEKVSQLASRITED